MKSSRRIINLALIFLATRSGAKGNGPDVQWDGWATREISVQVVSVESNQPIPRAVVTLSSLHDSGYPRGTSNERTITATTDDSGVASLTALFQAWGGGGGRSGWSLEGWLEVEHESHDKAAGLLVSFAGMPGYRLGETGSVGKAAYRLETSMVDITVRMRRRGGGAPISKELLVTALFGSDFGSIEALVKAGADINGQDVDGWTALMYAAMYNKRLEILSALLSAGADVGARDKNGMTALAYAVETYAGANPGVISLLLRAGADVDSRGAEERTLLMVAVATQNGEVIRLLVEAGSDVNARDELGWTALHYATGRGDPRLITPLLAAGAKIDDRNQAGETALIRAARYGSDPEAISLLLDAGADAKIRNKEGKTALDYASANTKIKDTAAYDRLREASR